MEDAVPTRTLRRVARMPGFAALALAALALLPGSAVSQPRVRPWTPAGMDSLKVWAAESRTLFRANTGDSLGGNNFQAYQRAGNVARHLIGSLGRGNLSQAPAVEAMLDSLGLDTDVAADPTMPFFALVMVRNPFRPSADVAGFFYWYQGTQLRYQGIRFTSGRNPIMRVWRTRDAEQPYSWAVVENARYGSLPLQFSLMRMAANGTFWRAAQYPGNGPDMGGRGDAAFADLNNDGVPELVTWSRVPSDSLFNECRECPGIIVERTWSERSSGFELIESRVMPTAYANFVAFIRFLREGNRAAAARLLATPAKVQEAFANGWDKGDGRALWRVINVERDETWPHWITVRFGRGDSAKNWVFHFVVKDGRWIIRDWVQEKAAATRVGAR